MLFPLQDRPTSSNGRASDGRIKQGSEQYISTDNDGSRNHRIEKASICPYLQAQQSEARAMSFTPPFSLLLGGDWAASTTVTGLHLPTPTLDTCADVEIHIIRLGPAERRSGFLWDPPV